MNDIFYWLEGLDDLSYNKVKDYITNLQQFYKDNVNRYEELIEKYSNLQQELEKTKPCGKTYYEMNSNWKYLKTRVKQILDEKQSSREYKINMIISMLEHYKSTYLISKGSDDNEL